MGYHLVDDARPHGPWGQANNLYALPAPQPTGAQMNSTQFFVAVSRFMTA